MVGTNDCLGDRKISLESFGKNLEFLIDSIRTSRAIPILHTPNLINKEKAPGRHKLGDYADLIRYVAISRKTMLIDHWNYWQNEIKMRTPNILNDWLDDPIHPNRAGHMAIATLMVRELYK